MTYTDSDMHMYRPPPCPGCGNTVRPDWCEVTSPLTVMLPASPWQRFKATHAGSWWLGWVVRRWPVVRVMHYAELEPGQPIALHHCDPDQFVAFGGFLNRVADGTVKPREPSRRVRLLPPRADEVTSGPLDLEVPPGFRIEGPPRSYNPPWPDRPYLLLAPPLDGDDDCPQSLGWWRTYEDAVVRAREHAEASEAW